MKGIILHHEKGWTYVLSQDGIYHRVRGLTGRAVAEEVELPLTATMRPWLLLSALAALAVLAGVLVYTYGAGSYYLCVDVNPSVEVSFNVFNRFISAKALNPEGEIILDGLRLGGAPEDVAASLLERIGEYEYISGGSSGKPEVCITVAAKDQQSCDSIEQRLRPLLGDSGLQNPIILGSCDLSFRERAQELGVSSGVLLWAERFQEQNEEIPLADILDMAVADIVDGALSQGTP